MKRHFTVLNIKHKKSFNFIHNEKNEVNYTRDTIIYTHATARFQGLAYCWFKCGQRDSILTYYYWWEWENVTTWWRTSGTLSLRIHKCISFWPRNLTSGKFFNSYYLNMDEMICTGYRDQYSIVFYSKRLEITQKIHQLDMVKQTIWWDLHGCNTERDTAPNMEASDELTCKDL